MALPKLILGYAMWKLHICRYNFQFLGNINCVFNPDINWKVTKGVFLFFYFIRLTLWKKVYFIAIYEWGCSSLYHLWTCSTLDSKEERSKFGIKSGPLNFCSPSTMWPWVEQATFSHPFTFSSKYWGGWS